MNDDNAPKNLEKNQAAVEAIAPKKQATTENERNESANNSVDNTVVDGNVSEKKSRDERPRNRRSPRHLRSHGQRRRQNSEQTETANTATVALETSNDPVEARYPAAEATPVASEQAVSQSATSTESTSNNETVVSNEVQQELFENTPSPVVAAVETQPEELKEVITEPLATTSPAQTEDAEPTAVQADLLETAESSAPIVDTQVQTEVVETKVATAETVAPVVDTPVKTEVIETKVTAAETVATTKKIKTDEDSVKEAAPTVQKPVTEKPVKMVKVTSPAKLKAKQKVRKQNRSSSEMVKPDTINTVNDIPTAFLTNDLRPDCSKSAKMAKMADVTNRSAAGPTKP